MTTVEDVAPLGVGIVYFAELEELSDILELSAYGVLEIEPQTFWAVDPAGGFAANVGKLASLAKLPGERLVHSVGLPIGNTLAHDPQALELLAGNARLLGARYLSEHLSFNRVAIAGEKAWTGFLLPPPQTLDGVAVAVEQLRVLRQAVQLPVAFETGVNYFRPQPGEIDDGDYFALIANSADSGILLDLHNLLANERNGRTNVERVIASLPLERVWEVHVAGGHMYRGFYLDAHDGLVSPALRELTEAVVPRLPNLRSIVFEAQPDSLRAVSRAQIDDQRDWLEQLWQLRGTRAAAVRRSAPADELPDVLTAAANVADRERATLARIENAGCGQMDDVDAAAHALVRELIGEARGGTLLRSVPLVSRLLMITIGKAEYLKLLARYCASQRPAMFPIQEASHFLDFAELEMSGTMYLSELIAFERATLSVIADRHPRRVLFPYNPAELLSALQERVPPVVWDRRPFHVEIKPHSVTLHAVGGNA
jgi:uncharacterized protein (UPF0276 family)